MHKHFDEIKNKFLTRVLQIYASKFLFVTNTIQTTLHVMCSRNYLCSSYSCSISSCSRNDLITGCLSAAALSEYVNSLVLSLSLNTMFINLLMRSGSGRVVCPKHSVDTISMKKALHDSLMEDIACLSSL